MQATWLGLSIGLVQFFLASVGYATPAWPEQVAIVQPGDTLYKIALQHNASMQALAWRNGLSDINQLKVGRALIIPPPAVLVGGKPAAEGKWIGVNVTTQTIMAFEGNTLLKTVVVSTGLPRTPTVLGQFSVYRKTTAEMMIGGSVEAGDYYRLPNVPYIMYFYRGYAIHGTYWHNNFGQPMSHGCVNLPTPEAKWFYEWAPPGTPVVTVY